MIIESYNDIPYFTCKSAEIRPKSKEEYSGRFEVAGKEFTVNITDERDNGKQISRVWARVGLVGRKPKNEVVSFALYVAAKQKDDPDFVPVKVDIRDGEAAFMKTWTLDYPDDRAMDCFIEECKSFIRAHFKELSGVESSQSSQGIAELLELL